MTTINTIKTTVRNTIAIIEATTHRVELHNINTQLNDGTPLADVLEPMSITEFMDTLSTTH